MDAVARKRKEFGLSPAVSVINHLLRQKELAEKK